MIDLEHQVQKAICQYLDMRGATYFAIPNGGKRNLITAKKLKAEGVQPGVPDICVIAEGGLAYFLEVKRPKSDLGAKGRLSTTQKAMIERLEAAGAEVAVVHSVADVIEACISWNINVL
jgi:phospholipase/lecithinase/hemolysin